MGKCISREALSTLTKKRSLTKDSDLEDKSQECRESSQSLLAMKSSDKKLIKNALKKHYLFKQLNKSDLQLIYERMKCSLLPNNEEIYIQGHSGSKFYIIIKGTVEIIRDSISICKLSKGQTFGEMALLTDSLRKETARSLTDISLWTLSRSSFKQSLKIIFSKNFDYYREFISKVKFFSNAADSQKDTLTRLAVFHEYQSNEVIVRENDDGELMFIILEGSIKFCTNETEIEFLEAGAVFGEDLLVTGSVRKTTAISFDNSKLLSLDKAALVAVFGENFREMIFKNIAKLSILNDSYLEFLSKENIIMLVESLEWNQYPEGEVVIPEDSEQRSKFLVVCFGELRSESGDIIGAYQVIGLQNPNERNMSEREAYLAGFNTVIGEIHSSNLEALLNLKIDSIFQEADSIKILKNISIFKYLSLFKLKTLSSKLYLLDFEKKEIIFNSKDPAETLYIIKEGTVEIYNDGKILRTLGKFDFFGERCISESTRSASARASSRTECWVLEAESLKNIMDDTISLELERKRYYQADMLLHDLLFVKVLDDKSDRKQFLTYYEKHKSYYNVQVINKGWYRNVEQCMNLVQEKQINLQLDYYLIIKLVKTFTDPEFIYFVTERIEGITLREYMKTSLRETAVRFLISCLVTILEYLHDRNIVYRDLSPENIFVNAFGYPHLFNFRCSKIVKGRTYTNIGNPFYKSPEIITGRGYSKSADYWSLGVLLHELLYNSLPFGILYTDDPVTIYEKVLSQSHKFTGTHSYVLANDLIEKLLVNDTRRVQGEDIRKSPWMKNIDWDKLLRPSTSSFVAPSMPKNKVKKQKESNVITLERFLNENIVNHKVLEKRGSYSMLFKWEKYF